MARGFILQPTYRIESGRPVVHLYGRLDTGESFLARDDRLVPHFYVRASDAAQARSLGATVREEHPPRRALTGEPVARVEISTPPDTVPLRDRLMEAGIPCFEADVRFASRYLIDKGIRGSLEIGGPSRPAEAVGRIFENPEIEPADWTPDLSVLSLDIETDPKARHLLSVALVGCGASEVLLLAPEDTACPDGARTLPTEAALLEAFSRRVRELDPDVLTGWNVINFDLSVLLKIADRLELPLFLGRGPEPLRLRPALSPRASSQAQVPGRVVLDGIDLLRGAFIRMESYSLNAVAQEVLGEGKTITGTHRAEEILKAYHEDRSRFVEYNVNDARLVLKILDRLHLVELAVERSRLTGMPPDRVAASIASFDFLYLSELARRKVVAPTVNLSAAPEQHTTGGHVLEPQPGLYRNILVLDFKSLYPSVIRTFQIDPLGYLPTPRTEEDPIVAPNGAAFRREPGILPRLLDDFFPRREAARAAGDRATSQAIKILMNSFYGVLGTPACRFASPELANAITGFGREILLWSEARIRAKGYRVLYGDTDSLFIESGLEEPVAARGLGARLVNELNAELSRHVREKWRVESGLELEFEKLYLRLMLPAVRHGLVGARKRYAGLVQEHGEPKVVFTGMEVVRRDWTDLAKRIQRELYERLFSDRPVEDYLRQVVAAVRASRFDHELTYRKALRKPLEAYTATTPPHVAAARKMREGLTHRPRALRPEAGSRRGGADPRSPRAGLRPDRRRRHPDETLLGSAAFPSGRDLRGIRRHRQDLVGEEHRQVVDDVTD
jgi:DNA polymerase-2